MHNYAPDRNFVVDDIHEKAVDAEVEAIRSVWLEFVEHSAVIKAGHEKPALVVTLDGVATEYADYHKSDPDGKFTTQINPFMAGYFAREDVVVLMLTAFHFGRHLKDENFDISLLTDCDCPPD